jgi:peptide/nickel transport system permease protein
LGTFLIRKLIYAFFVIWGVVTLVFFLFKLLPGDPARMVTGQRADSLTLEIIRKDLGLDRPAGLQYLRYLNDLSVISLHRVNDREHFFYLDEEKYDPFLRAVNISDRYAIVIKYPYLGRSFISRKEVAGILIEAFPNTLILALSSILIATILGILAGMAAAEWKNTIYDRGLLLLSVLGMSLPSFFAAILIGWLFAYLLGGYTGLNLTGNLYEIDDLGRGTYLNLRNLILPAITLGIRPLSIILQLTRNSLLDELSRDYIRTARAKGIPHRRILVRHALRNSLNPLVTAVSGWFASLMAGVIFVEYIFGWKGLGYSIVNALNNYDFPVVLGAVIFISAVFVVINVMVDITYRILDPRIRI